MHCPEFQRLTDLLERTLQMEPDRAGKQEEIAALLKRQAGNARQSLLDLYFSDAAETRLRRHFSYYFRRLNDLGYQLDATLERLAEEPPAASSTDMVHLAGAEVVGLTNFMLTHFVRDPDPVLIAHPGFCRQFMAQRSQKMNALSEAISQLPPDNGLRKCLTTLLEQLAAADTLVFQRYQSLAYFDLLLNTLLPVTRLPIPDRAEFLSAQLFRLNFNHLGFLSYLQANIRSEIGGLQQNARIEKLKLQLSFFDQPPHPGGVCYDPQWPGLCEMMTHWLREELRELQTVQQAKPQQKLTLRASVAHLACLIRVFHEDELPGIPLSEIFRWVAAHCSTKRQKNISPGSLNKQFYTVDQFTAARVRDRLLKMAAQISLEYFPAMAAIGAAYYGWSAS